MNDEIKEYVIKFHNTYEKLAPNYGYETRKDTKELDFNSNNGKLMYATINEIITPLLDYIKNLQKEKEDYKSRLEKAVKYNYELQERYCHSALYDELVASKIYEITEKELNILQNGSESNE